MAIRKIALALLLTVVIGAGARADQSSEETPSIDKDEQRIQELSLHRDQISGEMYAILKKIRREREIALKTDRDLHKIVLNIEQKQQELEKRLKEKYPDLKKFMSERDELQMEYNAVRKEIFELRVKKSEKSDKDKPSGKE